MSNWRLLYISANRLTPATLLGMDLYRRRFKNLSKWFLPVCLPIVELPTTLCGFCVIVIIYLIRTVALLMSEREWERKALYLLALCSPMSALTVEAKSNGSLARVGSEIIFISLYQDRCKLSSFIAKHMLKSLIRILQLFFSEACILNSNIHSKNGIYR